MIETRTRQKCENMDNSEENTEHVIMKAKEYKEYIKDSLLINKIGKYYKSKHNHSLNYLKLRKTKSYSDLYETRRDLEK